MSTWSLSGSFASKKQQSYVEGVESLERIASETKGTDLIGLLRNWCDALEELDPNRTHATSISGDGDWHDLGDQPEHSASSKISKRFKKLYREDSTKDPIDFRMLFLRSRALEKLLTGCMSDQETPPEVWSGFAKLLGLCLELEKGPKASTLVQDLEILSNACLLHHNRIVASKKETIDLVVEAISALKIHPELERFEGRIRDLKGEADMASSVSDLRGSIGDATVDVSILKEGGKIAKKNWDTGCELWRLVGLRNASFREGLEREAHYVDVSRTLDAQLRLVSESHSALHKKIAHTEAQHKVQTEKRDTQLADHSSRVEFSKAEVGRLQAEKHRLEEMLARVERDLEAAEKHCAEVKEDRQVYEEGENLLLEGVLHQLEGLKADGDRHSTEESVLKAARQVVRRLEDSLCIHLKQGTEYAEALEESSGEWWLSCGEKRCFALRDEIQLMLRQLRFCHSELTSLQGKQEHISEIGMQSMMDDVDRSRSRLQQKYLQAENATETLLQEANAVRKTILDLSAQRPLEAISTSSSAIDVSLVDNGSSSPGIERANWHPVVNGILDQSMRCPTAPTPGLARVFAELSDLESEYRFMNRPSGLPHSVSHECVPSEEESSFESVSPMARLSGIRVDECDIWEDMCPS
ncbi:hypothetical protein BSKO_14015 [Bryopsis sp. KO-2023]|nr:hypothetical protein BSKO_14015 [Bryopsis sp. KO-2023]